MLAFCLVLVAWRFDLLSLGADFDIARDWMTFELSTNRGALLVLGLASLVSLIGAPSIIICAPLSLVGSLLQAASITLAGCLIAAAISYALGRLMGRHLVRKLLGLRVNEISKDMMRRGIFSFALLRAIPVTAQTHVGIIAGASRARIDYYAFGSLIGYFWQIVIASVFALALDLFIEAPNTTTSVILLATIYGGWAALQSVAAALRRRRISS